MAVSRPTPVLVTIDPRFRRRRIEVKRRAGRRRLRVLVGILILFGLTVASWVALRSPLLDVDRIELRGAAHTPRNQVLQTAGVHRGLAMVDVDEAAGARRLARLPWIAEARVWRAWPSTVLISVTERVPAAVTSADGQTWALVDRAARVLDVSATRPPGLVSIEGLGAPGPPASTLGGAAGALRVVTALPRALQARVTSVVALQAGEIALKLDPHGTVRLGPPDDLGAKVRAVETVLAQVDTRNLDVLDVRLPSSPVLTRR